MGGTQYSPAYPVGNPGVRSRGKTTRCGGFGSGAELPGWDIAAFHPGVAIHARSGDER